MSYHSRSSKYRKMKIRELVFRRDWLRLIRSSARNNNRIPMDNLQEMNRTK